MIKMKKFFVLFASAFLVTGCALFGGNNNNNHEHDYSRCFSVDDKYHVYVCSICGQEGNREEHQFEENKAANMGENVYIDDYGNINIAGQKAYRCSKCDFETNREADVKDDPALRQSVYNSFKSLYGGTPQLYLEDGDYSKVYMDGYWRNAREGWIETSITLLWKKVFKMMDANELEVYQNSTRYGLRGGKKTRTNQGTNEYGQQVTYESIYYEVTLVLDKNFNIICLNGERLGYFTKFELNSANYMSAVSMVNRYINNGSGMFNRAIGTIPILVNNYNYIRGDSRLYKNNNYTYSGRQMIIYDDAVEILTRSYNAQYKSYDYNTSAYMIKDNEGKWKISNKPYTNINDTTLEAEIAKVPYVNTVLPVLNNKINDFIFDCLEGSNYVRLFYCDGDGFYQLTFAINSSYNNDLSLTANYSSGEYEDEKEQMDYFEIKYITSNVRSGLDFVPENLSSLVHTHTYTEDWMTTEYGHYHASTCGHQDEEIQPHTWIMGEDRDSNGYKVMVEATYQNEGIKERECSVCGYKEQASIPMLYCDHPNGLTPHQNEISHWEECEICGEKFNEENHSYGDWIYDYTAGTKHKECSTCGYQGSVAYIPTLNGDVPNNVKTQSEVDNAFSNISKLRETMTQTIHTRDSNNPNNFVDYTMNSMTEIDTSYNNHYYVYTENSFANSASATYFTSQYSSLANSKLLLCYDNSSSGYKAYYKNYSTGQVTSQSKSASFITSQLDGIIKPWKEKTYNVETFLGTQSTAFKNASNLNALTYEYTLLAGGAFDCTIKGAVDSTLQGYAVQLAFEDEGMVLSFNSNGMLTGYVGTMKIYVSSGGMYYFSSSTYVNAQYEYNMSISPYRSSLS